MIESLITIDQLIESWVEGLLTNQNQLLAIPLSKDLQSPANVNVLADFVSNEVSISFYEAHRRRHLTLPLIEKMMELQIIIKGASKTENFYRQKILYWYSTLNFENKKQLPRMAKSPDNICFESIGNKQRSWLHLGTQHDLIGKTIDELHQDLHKLGIIGVNFQRTNDRRRLIKDAKSSVIEWVSNVLKKDEEYFWKIPITKASTPLGFNVAVEYIQSTTGISAASATKYRILAYPLIEMMFEKKILTKGDELNEVSAIENRRRLLNWYRHLSLEEKHSLPIFGNKISLSRMPPETRPIQRKALDFHIVKKAWNDIHEDLKKAKIIESNYRSVNEKKFKKLLDQRQPSESKKARFNRLGLTKLNTMADFVDPSESEPFIQIEQLFASQCNTVPTESSKSNYRVACTLFNEFLSNLYGTVPFKISTIFDEHILSRFRIFLENKILCTQISTSYANTILSSVRITLERLTKIPELGYRFFDISGFDTFRETDTYKPFTKNERLQITDAIKKGLEESRSLLVPYKKSGVGRNPLNDDGSRIRGLSTLDNARWLFENPLGCKPVHFNTAKSSIEKAFLNIINDSDKGLNEVYHEWGVLPMIKADILLPYILQLAKVTGLNAESLLYLDIDDYVPSHPATSRPCLRYWKERSDGYKEYHLDLFNAELTWITSDQAKYVSQIFQEVIQFTSTFRLEIEDNSIKNRLFIYQSNSTKKHGRVSLLLDNDEKNVKKIVNLLSKFVDKHSLMKRLF